MSAQQLKFGRLGSQGAEFPVVDADGTLYDLRQLATDVHASFLGTDFVARTRAALEAGELPEVATEETYRVGAPISAPGKIVCIGLNYRDHADETGAAIPAEPIVFMKDPFTVIGPFDEILIPRNSREDGLGGGARRRHREDRPLPGLSGRSVGPCGRLRRIP